MKKIFSLLAFLPLMTIAQPKTNSVQQVLFTYDQSNRVIGINQKQVQISKTSGPIGNIVQEQKFEYLDNSQDPYVRKINSYQYNRESLKWYITAIEQQYFLYKDGKHIGDSSLYLSNGCPDCSEEARLKNLVWDEKNAGKRTGQMEQNRLKI